jgi:transposase
MVVLGIDAHKRTHTVVAVDETGRKLGERTLGTTTGDRLAMLTWAERFGPQRRWAVEDCRHLSRRLERDLLSAANAWCACRRSSWHTLVTVLAATASPTRSTPSPSRGPRCASRTCPRPASMARSARVRLLASHRDDLVAERTRIINRLRWHLHELDPSWQPAARTLWRPKNLNAITEHLNDLDGLVARLARVLVERCRDLTAQSSSSTASSNHW